MEEQVPLSDPPKGLKRTSNAAIGILGLMMGLGGYIFRKRYIVEAYATEFEVHGYGAKASRTWYRLAIRDSEPQAEQLIAELRRRLPGTEWFGRIRMVEEESLANEPAEPTKETEEE
jgi:hypothetical protein